MLCERRCTSCSTRWPSRYHHPHHHHYITQLLTELFESPSLFSICKTFYRDPDSYVCDHGFHHELGLAVSPIDLHAIMLVLILPTSLSLIKHSVHSTTSELMAHNMGLYSDRI